MEEATTIREIDTEITRCDSEAKKYRLRSTIIMAIIFLCVLAFGVCYIFDLAGYTIPILLMFVLLYMFGGVVTFERLIYFQEKTQILINRRLIVSKRR